MVRCLGGLTISTCWYPKMDCLALDRVLIGAKRLEKLFELYTKMSASIAPGRAGKTAKEKQS